MGIYEDLKFVTGQGVDMGPGEKWARLAELLSEGNESKDQEATGYLAGVMVNSELRGQGSGVADLSVKEWAIIGSRFAADSSHLRTAECTFIDDGFMKAGRQSEDLLAIGEIGGHI
jgi:hypothetical protein